jgi:streptogramin lyase
MRRFPSPALASKGLVLLVLLHLSCTARAAKITEFPLLANSRPFFITLGPDGRLWFTDVDASKIGAITRDGAPQEWDTETSAAGPIGITVVGPRLYFTEGIGRFGSIDVNGVQGPESGPLGALREIVGGPDGRVWMTLDTGLLAHRVLSNGPSDAYFDAPTPSAYPRGIAIGSDGRIWFTEPESDRIGACSPEGAPCVDYPVTSMAASLKGIAAGPDGNLWFAEYGANKVGKMSPAGAMLAEYPVPTADAGLEGIAAGPDGNVWFTEKVANKIGRVTPSGVVTEYPIPTPQTSPVSLTTGPDGNIWFTEGNKIGRLQVFIPGDVDDSGTVDVLDVFYLINFLFAAGPPPK